MEDKENKQDQPNPALESKKEDQPSPAPPKSRPLGIYVVVAVLALVLGGYALHEYGVTQSLAGQNDQMVSSLNAVRSQIDGLAATLNTLAAQTQPPQPPPAPETAVVRRPVSPRHHTTEDPRLKNLQSQVDAQGKAIDETRSDLATTRGDLTSTRTELTGSIARTHAELVVLQKRGERNYYEFDIAKSKQFQHDGPLGIRLRKANDKHQYTDLDLLIDDRNLSQKHVNLYQPVMFYTPDSPQPVELVINSISKDHIHGYVGTPKYRQSELASMSNADAQAATAAASQTPTNGNAEPAPRQKLPAPK
jgi:hypothetical protein